MKTLHELVHYLSSWCLDCQKQCQYATLTEVQTLQDITTEAEKEVADMATAAFKARVADDEAARLLDQVLSDGRVTRAEVSLLRQARRNVKASAKADHNIAEVLT